jgi:phage terminase large subunit-like protein
MDAVTKRWIRNASDERAAANGCRFNEKRGQHVIDFMSKYLRLYEGDSAGKPFSVFPWQHDLTMRLFGWEKYSTKFKRWVRRFTQSITFVAKKNGKSPLLAAYGLYLLCADGEMGQKVFLGAVDGQQAREIAGKHCIEMLMQSEPLLAECTINKSLMQITHEPTRSVLKPISSNDARHQKSKEGINGSVLIDEVHVVDADFMGRISRAGISRSEPLQIEVSTAGDDPEGYGKKRYDYGKQVEAGTLDDERLLFVSYEAPQQLTDDELASDPVKYGKLANPSWGYTIDEAEYLADYNQSKGSLTELGRFKMYRLDIWQATSNPWLRVGDWQACRGDYTLEDLRGQSCVGGLDLGKTKDLCALVLIFDGGDGTYRQWPFFWVPEERAREVDHLVQLRQWAKEGWLTIQEGRRVIDYNAIRADIHALKHQFEFVKVAYDQTYATPLVERLVEEDGWDNEIFCEFKQTIMEFAGPTAWYEKNVIDGKLLHNGSPLLSWQAGHVNVKCDVNQNKRPVKPPHGDHRTIDGIVAGIMAGALVPKLSEAGWFTPEMIRG